MTSLVFPLHPSYVSKIFEITLIYNGNVTNTNFRIEPDTKTFNYVYLMATNIKSMLLSRLCLISRPICVCIGIHCTSSKLDKVRSNLNSICLDPDICTVNHARNKGKQLELPSPM